MLPALAIAALLTSTTTTTTPSAAPAPKSVLVLDLTPSDVPANTAKLLTELVTDATAKNGLRTVSAADLRKVAELNADKAALGCDTSSCLAEMANAMGVDYVLFGDVGKLGDAFIVTLRVFDSAKAEAVGRETIDAKSVEDLRTSLAPAVGRLLSGLTSTPTTHAPYSSTLLWPGVVVAGVGVAAGVGLGIYALVLDGTVGDKTADPKARGDALNTGPTVIALAAVGGVVAVVGGALIGAAFVVGGE